LFSLDLVDGTVFLEAGPDYNSRGAFCWEYPKNVGCADRCRKIPIALIDGQKGEQKAHACAMAW
jgi:hypothetical protein